MTTLTTERLLLQEATYADAPFIFELLNTPTWIQHIGDRGIITIKDAENYIQKSLINSFANNGFGMFKVSLKSTKEAMGLCGLLKREELEHVDIGFAILPRFTRMGYTYEGGKAVIEHAKNDLNISIIYGITSKGNLNSRNLLEKLGLRYIKDFQFGDYEELSLLFSNE